MKQFRGGIWHVAGIAAGFLVALAMLSFSVFLLIHRSDLEGRLAQVEARLSQSGGADDLSKSEYQEIIEFMKSETQLLRDEARETEDRLIWLVGIIGGTGVFILGVLGLANKREVKSVISETLTDEVKEELKSEFSEYMQMTPKRTYLDQAVNNQQRAQEKKICFIYQMGYKDLYENVHKQVRNSYGDIMT